MFVVGHVPLQLGLAIWTGFPIPGFGIEGFLIRGLQDPAENVGFSAVKPIMWAVCVQYQSTEIYCIAVDLCRSLPSSSVGKVFGRIRW